MHNGSIKMGLSEAVTVATRGGFKVVGRAPKIESVVFSARNLTKEDWKKIADVFNPQTGDELQRFDTPDYTREVVDTVSPWNVSLRILYLYENYNVTVWVDLINEDRDLAKSKAMTKQWRATIVYRVDNFRQSRTGNTDSFKAQVCLSKLNPGLALLIKRNVEPVLIAKEVKA